MFNKSLKFKNKLIKIILKAKKKMTIKNFNIKSQLTSRIIYKNLNNFINRLDISHEYGFIKIIAKVSYTNNSRIRFISSARRPKFYLS